MDGSPKGVDDDTVTHRLQCLDMFECHLCQRRIGYSCKTRSRRPYKGKRHNGTLDLSEKRKTCSNRHDNCEALIKYQTVEPAMQHHLYSNDNCSNNDNTYVSGRTGNTELQHCCTEAFYRTSSIITSKNSHQVDIRKVHTNATGTKPTSGIPGASSNQQEEQLNCRSTAYATCATCKLSKTYRPTDCNFKSRISEVQKPVSTESSPTLSTSNVPFKPFPGNHICCSDSGCPTENTRTGSCHDCDGPHPPSGAVEESYRNPKGTKLASFHAGQKFTSDSTLTAHRSGRRRGATNRPLNLFPVFRWIRMSSLLYLHLILFSILCQFLSVDGCSSRSTPKPRPASPTQRPNITIETYVCPPEYDQHFCLNGATCFTVKIGESILYNCECAEGYMGQRCDFKDLDSNYLPEKQRRTLEQAGITSSVIILVVIIFSMVLFLYLRSRRNPDRDSSDEVDNGEARGNRPFSWYNNQNLVVDMSPTE